MIIIIRAHKINQIEILATVHINHTYLTCICAIHRNRSSADKQHCPNIIPTAYYTSVCNSKSAIEVRYLEGDEAVVAEVKALQLVEAAQARHLHTQHKES